jgi:hypothetical protein
MGCVTPLTPDRRDYCRDNCQEIHTREVIIPMLQETGQAKLAQLRAEDWKAATTSDAQGSREPHGENARPRGLIGSSACG